MSWKEPRTAESSQSIWRDLPEDVFREHLVALEECTNAVPIEIQTFPINEWNAKSADHSSGTYLLPLEVEQQIADDFAFLVAVEEGAQSVAACCLEEHIQPPRLSIRFAALDISLSNVTKEALRNIAKLLEQAAISCGDDITSTSLPNYVLFRQIVKLHFSRLLARLRSIKWQKPKYLSKSHKKPLWQDFANLIHRVQFVYTKKESQARRSLESLLQNLASVYQDFETTEAGSVHEFSSMLQLIERSFQICTSDEVKMYAQRLQSSVNSKPTTQVSSAIKCLRQLEKIAAHKRIPMSLVTAAEKYPILFKHPVVMHFLTPYMSIPTTIGYESWAKTCHVHAEVQLAVHYDISRLSSSDMMMTTTEDDEDSSIFLRPRAIGTSKYLCYLCHYFLRAHKHFFPSNTHGRLYDQWTIPDLAEYDEEVSQQYRDIVKAMDDEVIRETGAISVLRSGECPLVRWRAEPMTSRQNLLDMDMQSADSTTGDSGTESS